jgi:hypothetical protein
MKREEHELYEYARKTVKQRKRFYYHVILFLLGSLAIFITNTYLNVDPIIKWYPWAIAFWLLILILHFIKVYITDRFMGTEWERQEIDKLVKKQKDKKEELEIGNEIGNDISKQQ